MSALRANRRRGFVADVAAMAVMGLAATGPAPAQELVTDVSSDAISIESTFTGAEIVLFGSIEHDARPVADGQGYDIIIVTRGPAQNIVARRKSRLAGIWVNREARHYVDAPSYLAILSNRPFDEIAEAEVLSRYQLGLERLILHTPDPDAPPGGENGFREAFLRLMRERAHYIEDAAGVEFLSPALFKASIPLPASVPVGIYRATVYLFGDGVVLARADQRIRIRKTGVEQLVSVMATEMPLLYGLVAVALAILSGWLAGIVFRRD